MTSKFCQGSFDDSIIVGLMHIFYKHIQNVYDTLTATCL